MASGVLLPRPRLLRRLQLRADDLVDGGVRREARQVGDAHGLAAHLPPVLVHPGLQRQAARRWATMSTHADPGERTIQWLRQGRPAFWQRVDSKGAVGFSCTPQALVPSKQQRTLAVAPASLNCTAAASWSEKVRRRSMSPYTSNTCRREMRSCHRAFKTACSVCCAPHLVLHS